MGNSLTMDNTKGKVKQPVAQATAPAGGMVALSETQFAQLLGAIGNSNQAPQPAIVQVAGLRNQGQIAADFELNYVHKKTVNDNLARQLTNEGKVPVSITPTLKPFVGDAVTLAYNGTTVKIPADGNTYHIPKTFKPLLDKHLSFIGRKFATRVEVGNAGAQGGVAQIAGI